MRKTVNIVTKMRTTNCKISIFCSVSTIFTLFLMCVKFILICLLKKMFMYFYQKLDIMADNVIYGKA